MHTMKKIIFLLIVAIPSFCFAEEQKIILPLSTMQKIVIYLEKQPYNEVALIINEISAKNEFVKKQVEPTEVKENKD